MYFNFNYYPVILNLGSNNAYFDIEIDNTQSGTVWYILNMYKSYLK